MAEPDGTQPPLVRRAPSVKDVALRAGVSWKTVSNVVNGRPSVRPETRARVEDAIEELGYRTSLVGRQLRSGRTNFLALAVPEILVPYFAGLAREIIRSAKSHGYTVLITETNADPDQELDAARGFGNHFADGIILSPTALDAATILANHGGTPLVLLGERVDSSHVDHVTIDNEASGREATTHLLGIGCERILFVGANQESPYGTGWLRMLGYRQALESAGRAFDPSAVIATDEYSRRTGARTVRALLDSGVPFDGLVCGNDLLAIGSIYALREHGIRVPDDVAVVGWDDAEEGAYSCPTLTTIAPDVAAIADTAVELLLRRVEGHQDGHREVVVGHVLRRRESTSRDAQAR